jgi:hypothetical protein
VCRRRRDELVAGIVDPDLRRERLNGREELELPEQALTSSEVVGTAANTHFVVRLGCTGISLVVASGGGRGC